MHTEPIIRNCALRFAIDEDPAHTRAVVVAWNRRFSLHCEGVGYFPDAPVLEEYRWGGAQGGTMRCHAFYLRADSKFWEEILSSRTFTLDEPVLGRRASGAGFRALTC